MSLCKLVQHWNGNVVILMAFSSLVALKVVTLTTFSATSDENFIKMMTFLFHWKAISKQHCYGIQKQHRPSTKAILTQHKSDTDPVQKRYRPGTKAILTRYKSDTGFSTVTQRVCTGSTGTRYKSGTGIRYRYVYRNGVQDVYRKVPYRYLVPYSTIPNRYHLPPLNSTGTGTDRYRNVYWVWYQPFGPYLNVGMCQHMWTCRYVLICADICWHVTSLSAPMIPIIWTRSAIQHVSAHVDMPTCANMCWHVPTYDIILGTSDTNHLDLCSMLACVSTCGHADMWPLMCADMCQHVASLSAPLIPIIGNLSVCKLSIYPYSWKDKFQEHFPKYKI